MITYFDPGPEFAYANADLSDATEDELLEEFAMVDVGDPEAIGEILDTIQRYLDGLATGVEIVVGDRGDDCLWLQVRRRPER